MASRVYLVLVFSGIISSGCTVDPTVQISEPVLLPGVEGIDALKGKDLDMVCVVQNKPIDTTVMWLQQTSTFPKVLTTDTSSEEPQKYAIFKPTSISWRLRIQNVEVADEGRYLCRVETQPKTYVLDVRYVTVVEPPQINSLQTSSDKVVKEDKELSLECNAMGRPPPTIIWTRLANADLPSGGKELRSTKMLVDHARPEHRGKYICRAENIAGEDVRSITVKVRFKPRVTADHDRIGQKVGYKKELLCDITAYPEAEAIGWTKAGASMEGDNNYLIEFSRGANNRVTSKLTIMYVRPTDYGQYICSGTNSEGNDQFIITLEETQNPTPDRIGEISAAQSTSFGLVTLLMLVSVLLLHRR